MTIIKPGDKYVKNVRSNNNPEVDEILSVNIAYSFVRAFVYQFL